MVDKMDEMKADLMEHYSVDCSVVLLDKKKVVD
jgi:hypothetical protein